MRYLKLFEQYASDVELVDTDTINKIPRGVLHQSQEYFNKLKEDIKQNGIKEPICVLYFVKENTLTLGEGHHRLQIANDLNIEKVPVRVIVIWRGNTRWNNYNVAHEIYNPPKQIDTETYKKRNYYPDTIRPSELGLK
jgi:hypothetical protein